MNDSIPRRSFIALGTVGIALAALAVWLLMAVTTPAFAATTVAVCNLQPDYEAIGGGGVYSAYYGPPLHNPVSPGSTAAVDGREAGIIKAGQGIDPGVGTPPDHLDGWDEGLFGFKPTVTINALAAGPLTYDVETVAGVNPVWMTIEIDTGVPGLRSDNTTYQFVPTSNPAGWHTVNAGAGLWQQWTTYISGITTGSPMTLSAVVAANSGLNVVRTFLRLGMGPSYYNGGTGTTAWVDKATIGGVTYDFVVSCAAPDPTPCPISQTSVTPTPLPTLIGGATVSPSPTPAGQTPAPGNPPQCLGPIKILTAAQVGTVAGTGPVLTFECKWEAPDMTPYDTTMTYGSVGHYDDTPWVTADAPACDPSATPAPNRHHTMGEVPNAENLPITRQYEKWVAIQSANPTTDIIDVYFKVYEKYIAVPPNGPNCGPDVVINGVTYPSAHPDVAIEGPFAGETGETFWCLEEQHHSTPTMGPVSPTNPLTSVPCTELQSTSSTAMFAQAVGNGAMTQAEVNNMINNCFQGGKRIFKVLDLLPKDKPCGEVRVEATAVNSSGNPVHLANYFDDVCFIHMQLDFTSVNWGTLDANGGAVVLGDMAFGTGGPTALNTGNAPMYLETMFDPMILSTDTSKRITSFDSKVRAAWQTDPSTLQVEDPQPANWWMCFSQHPIGHDQTGKIDLSVHTFGAQTGTYNGAVYIVARFDCAAPHDPGAGPNPQWTLHQAGH